MIGSAAAWQLCGAGSSGRAVRAVRSRPRPRRFARQLADLPACLPDSVGTSILASRAARLWRQLERVDGQRFYARTGAVDHGDPAGVQLLARTLAEAGLEHSLLDTPGRRAAVARAAVRHHGAAPSPRPDACTPISRSQHYNGGPGPRAPRSGITVPVDRATAQPVRGAGADQLGIDPVRPGGGRRRGLDRRAARGNTAGWPASGAGHHPGAAGALRPDRDARGLAQFHPPPRRGVHRARASTVWPRRTASRSASTAPAHGWTRTPGTSDRSPTGSPGCSRTRRSGCPASIPATPAPITCLYTTTPDHHFVIDRHGPITVAAGLLRPRFQVRTGRRRTGRRPGQRVG